MANAAIQPAAQAASTIPAASGLALAAYVKANGSALKIGHRTFVVEGLSEDGDISVATFVAVRARYPGVRCVNAKVIDKPGAEVWSIISGHRTIANFAIWQGELVVIRH